MKSRKTKTYVFFRKEGWYPIELYDDADAIKNAEYNKGTLKVEDENGKTIWKLKDNKQSQ